MAVITFTQENFEQEVLKSSDITIVDFWATCAGHARCFHQLSMRSLRRIIRG